MLTIPMEITGIILAGGKSRRLDYKNKALLQIGGKSIVERVIDAISGVTDKFIMITNSPDDYEHLGLPMFGDVIAGTGPLGGIYSGLARSGTHNNIIVACDMPFIQPKLFELLISHIADNDIVIPVTPDGYHPLCAVYSKNCIKPVELLIEADQLKVTNLFRYVKVNEMIFSEEHPYYAQDMLFNVNTHEDYAKAIQLCKTKEGDCGLPND